MGLAPPLAPQFAPATVEPSMRAAEVALANLRGYLSSWFAHEPGARLGDDPEQLHMLRVTARRMDALFSLYRPYLPRTLVRSRATLKSLLRILGAARDLDVQLAELTTFCAELTDAEKATLEPLRQHLESERVRARSRMLRTLDSASTRQWFEKLAMFLAQPSTLPPPEEDEAIAAAVAPDLIRRRFRKLRKGFGKLTDDTSMEDYHTLRARAKKLRYATESVSVMYGKPADEMLRALRRLQERLGRQQDAYVARNRLLTLANDPPKGLAPGTLFLMGRLAERHTGVARSARKRIGKTWRKVCGRRWKALRRRLEEMRGEVSAHTALDQADADGASSLTAEQES
jgi:triphosphatase